MKFPALVIDTSNRYLIFARIEENKGGLITAMSAGDFGEDTIDTAVSRLFPDTEEIAEVWLGEGPGSFVGLRSSFAYVRMLIMLRQLPCRTFLSSRLWRRFFSVAPEAWFLMRTNAKLYYAERYTPEREAEAVEMAGAAALSGQKFCFMDSWVASQNKNTVIPEGDAPWTPLTFSEAKLSTEFLTPEFLHLSESVPHQNLAPLYGHELNFVLAAEKKPLTKNI